MVLTLLAEESLKNFEKFNSQLCNEPEYLSYFIITATEQLSCFYNCLLYNNAF